MPPGRQRLRDLCHTVASHAILSGENLLVVGTCAGIDRTA